MISGEDVTGSAHVGGQLVHIVDPVYSPCGDGIVAQIANYEVIRDGAGEFRVFEIYATNPKTFVSQSGD